MTEPTEDPRDALESDDVAVRVAGARVLAERGTQEDLPRLIKIAREDKSPSVRLYAAAAASDVAMRNRRELTDAAKEHLVRVGYDPTYGARPLKRAIQREIETALGRRLLRGEIHDGDAVLVDYDPNLGALTFTPKEKLATLADPAAASAVKPAS